MRYMIIMIAAVSLALAGCATTPATRLTEGRGMATAWASLDAVAVTLDGLAVSRTLHGEKAAQVAQELTKAKDALTAADAAYRAGNNASGAQNAALASSLIASLLVIANSGGK